MKLCIISLVLFVEKSYIGYIKHIIEAYDNVAVLTTIDSTKGLVALSMAYDHEDLVIDIIQNLSERISIKVVGRNEFS